MGSKQTPDAHTAPGTDNSVSKTTSNTASRATIQPHLPPAATNGLIPVVTGDESLTLFSPDFQETYHSIHGALTESQTVFINGSNLPTLVQACAKITVLEIGFGLGLNFLLAADCAANQGTSLEYIAVENKLLPTTLLQSLRYDRHLQHPALCERLYDFLASSEATAADNATNPHKATISENITLQLLESLNDVQAMSAAKDKRVDVLFLDAFSPDCNQACWTDDIFDTYTRLLSESGLLTTYSAKGRIRRQLIARGFHVERLPGPPGKREFLRATRTVTKAI